MTNVMDEQALRKAWLKRKFASFEYHEEMLRLHRQWLEVLRKALARAAVDEGPASPGSDFKTMREEGAHFAHRYLPLIERNDDLGKYRKDEWNKYGATATFRSIPDYSRYLQSEGDMLAWMTDAESTELGKYWGPMSRMAQNIQYTVDDMWTYKGTDDYILDSEYTGPISWPANWRDDVADLAGGGPIRLRCEANHPCPREGYWFTPAKAGSRHWFKQGELMPDLKSDYGLTIWQWDEDQPA